MPGNTWAETKRWNEIHLERSRKIVKLLAEGNTQRQIAKMIGITDSGLSVWLSRKRKNGYLQTLQNEIEK